MPPMGKFETTILGRDVKEIISSGARQSPVFSMGEFPEDRLNGLFHTVGGISGFFSNVSKNDTPRPNLLLQMST